MNAPLSEAETARIIFAWRMLRDKVKEITEAPPDPVEMITTLCEVIGRCHDTQMIIYECWRGANKRAFPTTGLAKKRVAAHSALADLAALGISMADLTEALKDNETKAQIDALLAGKSNE